MKPRGPVSALLITAALLAVAAGAASLTLRLFPIGGAWREQAVLKTWMIALALAAMKVAGGGLAGYGFRFPGMLWRKQAILSGLGLGAAATATLLLAGAPANPVMRGLGLPAVIGWVFLYSSISEEIFCRGWLQSFLPGRNRILISGLFFGAMHLGLLLRGAAWSTVAILVIWTSALGLAAAGLRERTGSLLPPTVAHIAFNFGGALGGACYVIGYRLLTGHLPVPPL